MGIWAAVKHALNSTLGTSEFKSLDKLIDNVGILSAGGVQTFTSSGTFIVPDGVNKIWVTACGGGAGGSGGYYNSSVDYVAGCGGQGGSCIIREPFDVTPGQEIAITIGSGGSAGANGSGGIGSAGGSTVVGDLVTLAGGKKSTSYQYCNVTPMVGCGKGGDGGYYEGSDGSADSSYGVNGARGNGGASSSYSQGGGGGGSYGNGGDGANYFSSGSAASTPGYGGGGGGGVKRGSSTAYAASKGGAGIAIIEW